MTDRPDAYFAGSGELASDLFSSAARRSIAIAGNKLHVFTYTTLLEDDVGITHRSFDLGNLFKYAARPREGQRPAIDAEALTDAKNWRTHEPQNPIGKKPGLATNAQGLWAFYRALPIRALSAARFADEGWKPAVTLLEEDGESKPEHIGAAAAQSFGDTQFLVAAVGRRDRNRQLYFGVYDLNDIDEHTLTWPARSSVWRDVQDDFAYYYPGPQSPRMECEMVDAGKDIDIALFHSIADAGASRSPGEGGANDAALSFFAAISFEPLDGKRQGKASSCCAFQPLPADPDSGEIDPSWKTRKPDALYRSSVQGAPTDDYISSLIRDPAGRLRGFMPEALKTDRAAERLEPFLVATAASPDNDNGFGDVFDISSMLHGSTGSRIQPSSCLYLAQPAVAESKDDHGSTRRDYPLLEFVFYDTNKLQLWQYGTVRTVRGEKTPNPENAEGFILAGYIDSPIPVPVANFTGQEISSGRYEAGTFVFHSAIGSESEKRLETEWAAGFEAEGKATKGLGVAFKIAFEWGGGSVASEAVESEIEMPARVPLEVESDGADGWRHPEMHGEGYMIATRARFEIDAFQFFNAAGELINDALDKAPACGPKQIGALISMRTADPTGHSFSPLVVEPGNLESYKPEALNERMQRLGYADSADYFSDVVCRNAFMFGETPYLAFSWDNGNRGDESFRKSSKNFREQSWTFETSDYAGISGGGGFEIFGLGEEFEFELLGGGSYSSDRSTADGKIREWGIELDPEWGPLLPPENVDGAVNAYSFRAYFLPVPDKALSGLDPNHWAIEYRNYGDPELAALIDRASGCWRIVFVVTSIDYADGGTYRYSGREVKSVYDTA